MPVTWNVEFGSGLHLVSRLGAVLACFTKNERSVHHLQRCCTNKKKESKEKKDFCWEEPTKNCRYLMLQHQTTLHFAVFHCLYSGATDVHRHNSCLNCCVAGGRPLSEPYAAELQQFDENLANQPIVSNGLSSGHLIPRATDGTTILLILKL